MPTFDCLQIHLHDHKFLEVRTELDFFAADSSHLQGLAQG